MTSAPTPQESDYVSHEDAAPPAPAEILHQIHDGVISTDMNGIVTSWNRAAERIYGYTAEEAIGRQVSFLRFPEDVERQREEVFEPVLRNGAHEVLMRNRRKDGQEIFIALRLSLQYGDEGTPVAVIGCSNDISERVRIESALQRQREEQQIILDSMPAMVWYKDRDNRILRANRAAAMATGVASADLEGRSTYDIHPGEAADYHRDDLEVIRSGRAKLGIVEPFETATGERRWVRTDKIPYRNEAGEIVGVIVFAVDITDSKLAEQALEKARDELEIRVAERTAALAETLANLQAEMAERVRLEEQARRHQSDLAHVLRLQTIEGLAAGLAHEINQPLGAIANYASGLAARLREGTAARAELVAAADSIAEQAIRAAEVIRRLREFTAKSAPMRAHTDINEVVRDAARLIEPDARRHKIEMSLHLGSDLIPVEIDRIQVEQVILNLVRNGIESIAACTDGPRLLAVETRMAMAGRLELTVRDTGCGLPSAPIETLVEPFFTTKTNGLGMGLAISRSIVTSHGGTLWGVPNPDRGATFGFSLPARGRTD